MEYRNFENTILLRLDRGEEIVSSIQSVCKAEGIMLGSIMGLGAVDRAVVGLYKVAEQQYYPNTLTGEMEIAGLTGNITQKDGEVYIHIHASFADETGTIQGGHLKEAVVSATSELVIRAIPGVVGRELDKSIGLNVLKFD